MLDLILTAFDTIRGAKVRAFLTTLGVVIGVLAVILLVAIGEGARQYLAEQFSQMGSNVIQVMPGKRETAGMGMPVSGTEHKLTREDEEAISRRALTVDGASGIVNGAGTVMHGGKRRDTFIFGVADRFQDIRGLHVDQGRFFTADDLQAHRRYVVLGRKIVEDLFGDENPLGKSMRVADSEFRVIGITEHRGQSLGFDLDDLVVIPETTAMDLFGLEGLNNLILRARDRWDPLESTCRHASLSIL